MSVQIQKKREFKTSCSNKTWNSSYLVESHLGNEQTNNWILQCTHLDTFVHLQVLINLFQVKLMVLPSYVHIVEIYIKHQRL